MSRSCHSATFSTAAAALPRRTRARPVMRSVVIGLRLCGIALEPFWPARNGSSTSRTSVRWRWRISVAKRSRPAPASAIACSSSAWRSRATTCVDTGSRSSPSRSSTRSSNSGEVARVGADRAGDRADDACANARSRRSTLRARLHREAGELDAERRRLGVHAVRAPDADGVDVLARALGERGDELARAAQHDLARRAQLQRRARCRARRWTSGRSGSSGRRRRPTRSARRRTPRRRGR